MLNLKKVAVTGGLSSGKSAVCNFFRKLNAYVISADEIVHQLLSLETKTGQQVAAIFGPSVIKNEKLDRQAIADVVFKDPALLKKLEECIYPAVTKIIERQYQEAKHLNPPLFLVEIPKLFEAGMETWFDAVITVSSDENLCRKRFEAKGGTEEEYARRMASQMPIKEKIRRSNYIIENNGGLDELKTSVEKLFHVLTQEELHPK